MFLGSVAPLVLAATSPQFADRPPVTELDDEQSFPLPDALEEIIVDRDRYERMTVPVTIRGQGPYRFLVDTGAQATVLSGRVVEELQLKPTGRATLIAMGSSAVVPTIEVDRLEFAKRRFNGLRTPLLESRHIGADGILGLDSLQDLRVLIDFEKDRITVAGARELGGNAGFEIVVRARRQLGQMIITDARVNNVQTNVVIDTGAQRSFGNRALEARLYGRDRGIEIATDVNGVEVENALRIARRVSMGGISLNGVAVGFADSPVFAALGLDDAPALILGIGDLRSFRRVAIDFDQRRILFDLPREMAARRIRQSDFFDARTSTRTD